MAWAFRPDSFFMYASIDLGGTNIAAAIASRDLKILVERGIPTRSHEGPKSVLKRAAALVAELAEESGVKVEALGMGLPGLIDVERGIARFLPNMPTQWRNVPAARILSKELSSKEWNCRVSLLNDARLATLGELRFGHGRRKVSTMLLFTLGTGIGGGVVVDGRLRMGPLGAAGELGHQTVDPEGPICGCGNRGCIEAIASAPALAGEGVRLLLAGLAPRMFEIVEGDAARVTPETMGQAARKGDETVRLAIGRAARALGIGAANLITALHPELVVITGGMADLGDLILDPLRAEVKQRVRMFPADTVRIERSLLGAKAGIWGGIALASEAARRGT